MAHGWNPYMHSYSSLPSDHGTTDPEVSHQPVPHPRDDFIAHGGFSSATIPDEPSAENSSYFFGSSGENNSNWSSEIENAQRNYRELAWQPKGEQKAYLPSWDNRVSNFRGNVLERVGQCSGPPQVGLKQGNEISKDSQYFQNYLNNQGSSDQVCEPRSSYEFMTNSSERNSGSVCTPDFHSQWHQTDNTIMSADHRYSYMWPNQIADNAMKLSHGRDKSIQPDRISFKNTNTCKDSEAKVFDQTSKQVTLKNNCQNVITPETSECYNDQTMMGTSETNKDKHLDSANEALTENPATVSPKNNIIFSDLGQLEEDNNVCPSQSSSQSSASNALPNSDANLADGCEASNDSHNSVVKADSEKVKEALVCSPASRPCTTVCNADSDSCSTESHVVALTKTECKDQDVAMVEAVASFFTSKSSESSTLKAEDKDKSHELTDSNAECNRVCCAETTNKVDKSDPVDSAAEETQYIDTKTNMCDLLDLADINKTTESVRFGSAANVIAIFDKERDKGTSISLAASERQKNEYPFVDSASNVTKAIDNTTSEIDLRYSDLDANIIETTDDKSNESDSQNCDSGANVVETLDNKTKKSHQLDSESDNCVFKTTDDKSPECDTLDFDLPARLTKTIENKPLESSLLDSDSGANVETIDNKTKKGDQLESESDTSVFESNSKFNESKTLDIDGVAQVTENIESDKFDAKSAPDVTNKTIESHLLESDLGTNVTETIDNKTNSNPLDLDLLARDTETIKLKTENNPIDSKSETIYNKTNESDKLDSFKNEQLCPERKMNWSESDFDDSTISSTVEDKAMSSYHSEQQLVLDSLNKMQEKETAIASTIPDAICDGRTIDNEVENEQNAFSNFELLKKEPQLMINPEEKSFLKTKVDQEFPTSSLRMSEKEAQPEVEIFSCLKSEISLQKPSDEEHFMWDDFGKPLTPSSSEMDETFDSLEMNVSTETSKSLQPIVLIKTSDLTHLHSGKYICAQCTHVTSSVNDLIEHHNCQHPVRPFQPCKSCGVYLVHQDQSTQHLCGQNTIASLKVKKKKRSKNYCKKCKISFSKFTQFVSHMRTHTGVTPYKCKDCGVYFAQNASLNRHRKFLGRCRQQKPIKQCAPKKVHKHSSKSISNCYVKLYDILKTHFCKFCGKCFKSPLKANKHFHNVHKKTLSISNISKDTSEITKINSEKRKYKCPLCPMTFSLYSNRNSHLKVCVKETTFGQKNRIKGRYQCPLCLATFSLQSNRYRHLNGFCLRNFFLFLGKDTSKPVTYPRHSNQMKTVLSKLKAEEDQLNNELSDNVAYTKPEPQFKCNVCQAVFLNKTAKYRHMKRHNVKGIRFKYWLSHEETLTSSSMTDTTERLTKKTDSAKCKYCEKSFGSFQSLKKHEITHKGDRPYYCSQCGKGFKSHVVLMQHKITHQRRIQCTVCKKNFPTIRELIQHRTSHPNRGMLQCPDCPQQFTYPVFLVRHLRQHLRTHNKLLQESQTDSPAHSHKTDSPAHSHKTDSPAHSLKTDYPCPFCNQVFTDAKLLRKHYLMHIPKSSRQCQFCRRRFTSRRYLLRHIARHIGEKQLPVKKESKMFKCRFCSRTFAHKFHLMKHHKGHCDKTLIRCPKCSFYYGHSKYSLHKKVCQIEATASALKETNQLTVNKVPSAEAKFRCQHCSQTFKYLSLYRRHLLTHKGVEAHACILCGQNFPSLALCSQHEASCEDLYKCRESTIRNNTENPFLNDASELKCKFCNKTFLKARNFRRHILTHNEVKPYRCKTCESCFSRYDHLKIHLGRCPGKEKLNLKPQICIPKISLDHIGTGWQKEFKIEKVVKKTLECMICVRKFETQSKLKWHNSMYHTVKHLKCMQCSTYFSHEKSLQNHMRNRRCRLVNILKGKTRSQQTEPTTNISSEKQNVLLRRMLSTSTEQNTFKIIRCHLCLRTFRTSALLRVHMALHGEKSFSCDCGKKFFQKAKLQRHITTCLRKQNQGSPNGFSCAYCSSKFLLFSQLQEHFLNSHKLEIKGEPLDTAPLQQHLSNIQNFETPLTSKLHLPIEGKTSQKAFELRECPYPCKICNRGFWNKTLLRNHFRKCRRNASPATQLKREDVQLRADIDMVLTDSEEENLHEDIEATEPQSKSSQEKKTAVYQCSECDKSFTDGLLLISHLEAHGREEQEKKLNKCSQCTRTFPNQARLEKHMKIHETEQFICQDCSTELPTKTDLEIHRRQYHDPSASYSCQICRYRFKTRTSYADHFSQKHPNNIFPCLICNRVYTLRASLIRHNKNHHEQKQKDEAEKSLSTRSSSESEGAAGHDEEDNDNDVDDHDDSDSADSDSAPYFPCHVCGKTFTTSESLEDHQRCHLGEKPFECAQCGQCFFLAGQLQQHERKHQSEFQCRICGRGFVSLFALRTHKHTSGKKRPFRCKKCSLHFTSYARLAEHMLYHQEESFPCDICNRIFPSKSSRADHRKVHLNKSSATVQPNQPAVKVVQADPKPSTSATGEFKYRCGVCCVRFRNPEELSEHGCLAGMERHYSCLDCDKHFLHSSHLKKHLLTHRQASLQDSDPSNQCNKNFSTPQDTTLLKEHEVGHSKETKCQKCGQAIQESNHKCSPRNIELMNIASAFADDDDIDVTGEDHCFCPFCNRQFSSRSNLLEHQNEQHPNEKSYTCKLCARTYAKQKYLDRHMIKHQHGMTQSTSQMKFQCDQCHVDFKSAKELSIHLKLHAADKEVGEYRCDMCYKSFGQLSLLRKHQESHVGEIVYECNECDKAFAFPHLLEEHQKSHV